MTWFISKPTSAEDSDTPQGLGGRWSLRGALKQGSCWFGCSASEGAVEGPGRFRRTRGGLVCG